MAGIEKKTFDKPDETRPFKAKGRSEIVTVGGLAVARGTFEPGWRWSEHVKPIVGTASCQTNHLTYVISGRLHVKHEDGTEKEFGPGDVAHIAPGHDAWVVGDEPCIGFEYGAAATYAKKA